MNQQSVPINIEKLDDGSGLAVVQWHKSCYITFYATKLKRAEKRASAVNDEQPSTSNMLQKYLRLSSEHGNAKQYNVCIFCDKSSGYGELQKADTFRIDSRVRKCALDLQDEWLLANLSGSDTVALEAKYHAPCLAALYNKAAALCNKDHCDNSE